MLTCYCYYIKNKKMQKILSVTAKVSASLLGCVLSLAVCLMGVHAKELTSLSVSKPSKESVAVKKTVTDDQTIMKVQHDSHNHVDHQTSKSIVKVFGDQSGMQTDARHLRKVRHDTLLKQLSKQRARSLFDRLIFAPALLQNRL